ncbi:MAG: exodeoxyribonuclease VII large subunit [Acetatifactor sp.]|nr:exodeoxyribonuclease VII large subunit [Acetatifactor sp.]
MRNNRNVFTVGQLNAYIKDMFMQDLLLRNILVRGEISNCKYHASGHIYFTLKDPKGVVNCVMFAGNRSGLSFRLTEGQQVIVAGEVSVFERDGKYQIYARQIIREGAGELYERYEQLKRELEAAGYFDEAHKQEIPRYIKTLGIVTADTGAAVRDIIQIARRRNPYVQIILYPSLVQGAGAAPSIVQGIQALERIGVDVMIVGRGGGSIEDLWAFNELSVAQAVYQCTVPIISAVGHETDTTIIDYVSDLRAPTPSAAAELAVTDVREIIGSLELYRRDLQRRMEIHIRDWRSRCRQQESRVIHLSPAGRIREKRMYCVRLEERLQERMQRVLQSRQTRLALSIERMKGLSPLEKLSSGYAYLTDASGKNIRSVEQVSVDMKLRVQLADGNFDVLVTRKEKA